MNSIKTTKHPLAQALLIAAPLVMSSGLQAQESYSLE